MPNPIVRTFAFSLGLGVIASAASAQTVRVEIDSAIREYLSTHPEQVQQIVKDYIAKNPDVLAPALAELIRRRPPADTKRDIAPPDKAAAIQENASSILNSTHQVVLGNPKGDVTMVEFFDYNCGYCKRALPDMLAMIQDDPNLRIVLKELPILGPGSVEAAQVAVALRMQDPTGEKYLAFHQRMLGAHVPADKARALEAAKAVGVDLARLETDLADPEITATLTESTRLARVLGIGGTPGYVIGGSIVPGAIGAAGLVERVEAARKAAHG